ncbi:TraY domain-containing protein [Neobacillus pocheonensis]|uniref:Relaxosome protein TraY n=1 Tax=Neobacillus pocheonensis TaxID=363869 RepID=A0ABT0W5P8_9BACI|nr:TraY domain-containing protein [Neobacillus pocheonensis]
MAIKKTKGAINITLEKEMIEKLRQESEQNKRTLSNEIAFIIEEYWKMRANQ